MNSQAETCSSKPHFRGNHTIISSNNRPCQCIGQKRVVDEAPRAKSSECPDRRSTIRTSFAAHPRVENTARDWKLAQVCAAGRDTHPGRRPGRPSIRPLRARRRAAARQRGGQGRPEGGCRRTQALGQHLLDAARRRLERVAQ